VRHHQLAVPPTAWLLACTLAIGWQKVFDANVRVGFLVHAQEACYGGEVREGLLL